MIKIMADSTCDLPEEMIEKYDIGIVSLSLNIEEKTYKDRIDIKPDDFYKIIEDVDYKKLTTSMPSPADYISKIYEAVEEGCNEILCICMSSGTSGSYQSAELAKEYFFEENDDISVKIHIVDSKCMSHGSGWLILKSCMMREKGASFERLIEFNEKNKMNVKHFLSVDDLDHLIRSGRLTNVSAVIGKILKLRPIMTMKKGKGAIVAKERGRKKVLKHYVNEFVKRNDNSKTEFIIIGYTSDIAVAENLKNKIRLETDFEGEIYIMQMGVVVGCHVGLGAVSMYFMEKSHKKDNLLVNEFNGLVEKQKEVMEKQKEVIEKIKHKK